MAEPVAIGAAREFLAKHGKIHGRPEDELIKAVKEVVSCKRKSTVGQVSTLCISPVNGYRQPCNVLKGLQSIVGDCQHDSGMQSPEAAKIKNSGALLGKDNIFIESLLCAVSLGDEEIVREVVRGVRPPRLEVVWATGDNVYVSGLDMSWNNFHIGDLLVMPNAVIVNTGYPHSACWKYATRAGDGPQECVNSKDGNALRMRGIKGALLLPSSAGLSATITINDTIEIVRSGTPRHETILQDCRTPLPAAMELTFVSNGKYTRAKADDARTYFNLLVAAGIEAGRIDQDRYKRNRSDVELQELGLQEKPMQISEEAKSGDGTIANVGVKVGGQFQCSECRQKFDAEVAKELHWKFTHDPNRHQED
eukprot:TRINITY_DN122095_c0_g1_i1.p1 TRINITY_DN122095_c0_g1~~TRINITY_DN122095_c0_g1_i1.p1  ORF type:complete len:365 (-),score=42.69 TRINITY_DN122095_c0_g1_i1:170-1264(-)